ncbi:MAG TPA: sucrase ferredoxin [Gaiellaceae bacterium]|nr:sucrase ferredoxin [Gaiellaceae bacterium]
MTGRRDRIDDHAARAPFCADLSRENDEPLAATASRIDNWFLIEYRGLWARDALSGSGLSDQVKQHLRDQVLSVPHGRLVFVRRPDRRGRPELVAFTAVSKPGETTVRRIEFGAYDDLRRLDLLAGAPAAHPLFLVCTHGKHDPCCARYGRPLYEALRDELEPDWAWQVSHIGGDRFAGNLVCLPEGLYYGRVDRETAGSVLDEHLARRILMANYRGRSIYTVPVQAAEHAVRTQTGLRGIDDLKLRRVEREGGSTRVTFVAGAATHDVRVDRQSGDLTRLTCNSDGLERPPHYVVRRA